LIATLLALTISALVAPVILLYVGRRGFYVLALAPLGTLVWVATHWPDSSGRNIRTETVHWLPELHMDIELRFTTLSAIMSVLILGVGALVLCYCAEYFDHMRRRIAGFGGELVAFATAMFGLVVSDNMLVAFTFWEATTVLSFLLVGFYSFRATSRRAATQALLVTTAGGLAMLVGLILLGERSGSYRFSDVLAHPPHGTAITVAVVLILVGALSKSAIVPMHFWLPGAMAAPTPVSAYLHAAAMVKAGIFLVALLAPAFAGLIAWQVAVIGLGCVTMLLGGWRSLRQSDLKLILAYGTVSQLGFLMVLVGVGDQAVALAGMDMLVAHAMFKAALFMVVGIIDHATGTRDIRRLARLGAAAPVLAAIAAMAGLSMAGIIPTIGFVGKEAAFTALPLTDRLTQWQSITVTVAIIIGSILTFAYTVRFLWGAFGRKLRQTPSSAVRTMDRPSAAFLFAPAVLGVGGIVAAFCTGPIGDLLEPYARSLPAGSHPLEHLALWHGFNWALGATVAVLVAGIGVFLAMRTWGSRLPDVLTRLSAERAYDAALRTADIISLRMTQTTQRGSLPQTQATIMATVVILPTVLLWVGNRNRLHISGFDNAVQLVIGFVIVCGAAAATVMRNRLAATLVVGITGYGSAVIFGLYGAPDLALTQVLVETLMLVIFVLVLRKLPAEAEARHLTGFRPVRALIGVAFGALLVGIGLFAAAARSSEPLHVELPSAALHFGNGSNAVNVLLVDIRAWDTMGEVSVLLVAATGVASMVFRNRRFGAAPRVSDAQARAGSGPIPMDDIDDLPDRPTWLAGSSFRDPRHRSMVLEVTTRLVFPTMVVLSVYFFYAGHNAPGGGFAGGLTMGLALVLRYLAGGRYELGEALPIDAGRILGAGLALTTGTAITSLFLGAPALSSAVLKFHLPIFGDVKMVTALFFDLGVYLIVVGLVLDVLRSLGARLDAAPSSMAQSTAPGSPTSASGGPR